MVERVNGGRPLPVVESPRRAGDPPSLVARAERIREVLGWEPKFDHLETIVRNQLDWEHKLRREPDRGHSPIFRDGEVEASMTVSCQPAP